MAWVTPESILGALILILPGFVFVMTQERLVPTSRRDFSKSAIEFFGYGATNFVVFAWAILPRIEDWSHLHFSGWDYLIAPSIAVVAPFVSAVGWVRLSQSSVLERLAGMGESRRTPEPTAWDFFFGRRGRPCWILVRLRDGTNVAGIFEKGCYASRYPEDQSLYIKRLYRTDSAGAIQDEVAGSAGAVISGQDIRLIEMWEMDSKQEEQT